MKKSFKALPLFALAAIAFTGCNKTNANVTVTFDACGGSVTPANGLNEIYKLDVKNGTVWKDVKGKAEAKKDRLVTKDWVNEKGEEIKDDFVISENITVYANYKIENVGCIFEPGKGAVINTGTSTIGGLTAGIVENKIGLKWGDADFQKCFENYTKKGETPYLQKSADINERFHHWSLTENGEAVKDTWELKGETVFYAVYEK